MKYLYILLLLFLSSQVLADHSCTGEILRLDIQSGGTVQVHINSMDIGNRVCALHTTHGLISAEACKAMYGLLLNALTSNREVTLYFNNDTNTACTKGAWIQLKNHGIYKIRIE